MRTKFDKLHSEVLAFVKKIDDAIAEGNRQAEYHAQNASDLEVEKQTELVSKASVESRVVWLKKVRDNVAGGT